jgi:hypothetical protein
VEAHQARSGQVNLAPPDRVPGGFGGEVSANEEGNRPDPLEDERESPAEIALNACYRSDNTRGEENTSAPAHADVGGDIGSKDGWYDFRSIGRGEGLGENNHISCDTQPS